MAELKTKPSRASVKTFIDSIEDEQKRKDCRVLSRIMKSVTGASPKMWGDSVVGFGDYHYKYASGREADWMLVGFSPRKQTLTVYIMTGFKGYDGLLKKLGKHKVSKSCLYVKKLEDVDETVLTDIIKKSVKTLSEKK
jgi:hypothetical protein